MEKESQFCIRVPLSLRKAAELSAREHGQSLAEWIRRAIQDKLEKEKNLESMKIQSMVHMDQNAVRKIALETFKECIKSDPNIMHLEMFSDFKAKYMNEQNEQLEKNEK